MMRKMVTMAREELDLEYCFPPLGPYILKDEVLMGVACVDLRILLRKGRYTGHLQWENISKVPTAWDNLYRAGVLGMGDTIYSRYGVKFIETVCPTRRTWFGKFM